MTLTQQCEIYCADLRNMLREKRIDEWSLCACISRWVNSRIKYRKDPEGRKDVWSLPLDTLLRGYGDCEDQASLKVWMLVRCGVDQDRLFVATVPGHAFAIMRGVMKRFCFLAKKKKTCVVMDNQDHTACVTLKQSGYKLKGREPYTLNDYLQIASNDKAMGVV